MGGLPKARIILRADAALSALLAALLLLSPTGLLALLDLPDPTHPAAAPGAWLWAQIAGLTTGAFAVALATAPAAGPPAARVVCGAAAVANLGSAALIVAALGSGTLGTGFAGAALLALVAVARLGFGTLEAIYWGRLRGAAR